MNQVKILTFLFCINYFFPSRTQSSFANMIKSYLVLNFKLGQRCGRVFKSNSPLKTNSHCPFPRISAELHTGRGDRGCAGIGSRVPKAPPLAAGDIPELVLQGHHWNQGSVRKLFIYLQAPMHRQR